MTDDSGSDFGEDEKRDADLQRDVSDFAVKCSSRIESTLDGGQGQRIDPPIVYNQNDYQRIKKMKLCNVHFLRQECSYNPCTHDHHYKPSNSEMQTLKYLSRLIPCRHGFECEDPKCIYGHKCPNDTEGRKDCPWGDGCKYEPFQHGIDRTPVKTFRVGSK